MSDSAAVASLVESLAEANINTSDDEATASAAETRRLLTFADRGLKLDSANAAAEVTAALHAGPADVTAFELCGNTIGIPAASAIGDALARHAPALRRLLWKDTFTGRLKTEIAPALSAMTRALALPDSQTHLVEIDLCDIAFGPNGVVGVTELLASPACYSLRILRMNNEGLGHQGCQLLTDALNRGLDASESAGQPLRLHLFSAGRNRLENVGAKMLSGPLSRMGSLRHLALYQNGIGIHGPEGVEALAAIVSANTGLRTLNLMDNSIKPDGARLLAVPLRKLAQLVELNLSDCLLLSEGAQVISDALDDSDLPRLAEVILSGNEIGREAALIVTAAAGAKQSLRRLDLNANQIGADGIELIRKHIKAALSSDSVLASFSDDEGEADGQDEENEGSGEETYGDEAEEDAEEQPSEADANSGLVLGSDGGAANGNRSLFDDFPANVARCSIFGNAASKTAAPSGGIAAFSFKAALAASPATVAKDSGTAGTGNKDSLFRPSPLDQAATSTVSSLSDEASALERLLAVPSTFKLDSLGPDPGSALLRATTRLHSTATGASDHQQRFVPAAVALCQSAGPQSTQLAESAAAALLEAALRADLNNCGRTWIQSILTETGLIKSESLRNRRRTCDLALTAPFWRGVGRAVTASGVLGPEQLRCLATCLDTLWPSLPVAVAAADAESAKKVLVDALIASAA